MAAVIRMTVGEHTIIRLLVVGLVVVGARRHHRDISLRHRARVSSNEDLLNNENYQKGSSIEGPRQRWNYFSRPSKVDGSEDELQKLRRSGIMDGSEKYDDPKEFRHLNQQRLIHRHPEIQRLRHGHGVEYMSHAQASSSQVDDYDYLDVRKFLKNRARGKRHKDTRTWTEEDKKSFLESKLRAAQIEDESDYELEVREAQNSSLCNYTVISVPNTEGRIPRDLEHVKCNHAGSRCQDEGTYCCIQTYRHVEVLYATGRMVRMKIYSGCVCSLQIYETLEPYMPKLDLDQ